VAARNAHARRHADAAHEHRRRRRRHLAVAAAQTAPHVAVAVHEAAHERSARGAPPPAGTVHPDTIAQVRDVAAGLARGADGDYVGVIWTAAGEWATPSFPSLEAASGWYGEQAERAEAYKYLAYFDKTKATGLGSLPSVSEVFGSSRAFLAHEAPPPPKSKPFLHDVRVPVAKTHYGPIAAAGAGLVAVGLLVFAGRRSRRRSPAATSTVRMPALPTPFSVRP
jgi:hypothetical protein